MARLKDVLQPGETLILRVPSVWGLWLPGLMVLVGLLNALPAIFRLAAGSGDFLLDAAVAVTGLFAVACGLFVYRLSRIWQILVTDRRLLHRLKSDPKKYEATPLAEIDEIKPYLLGDGLFVTVRDGSAVLPCTEMMADRIRKAFDNAKEAA